MRKEHEGFVLWFTGLSGAGKSTLADAVYKKLKKEGYKIERLDGDVVRENLTKDLGFSKEDRENNIKRVAFVSSLLSKHGVGVIASFISPYKKERDYVRKVTTNFCEVYISTSLKVCEERDVKGLYERARKGLIENFTGISDPYEIPKNPEIKACCDGEDKMNDNVDKVLEYIEKLLKTNK